jgi:hypothetical protein
VQRLVLVRLLAELAFVQEQLASALVHSVPYQYSCHYPSGPR